jgi:antitoxin ParD1/3/4
MHISLPPDLEQFVAQLVESGTFTSAEEVVWVGLRLLQDREEVRRIRTEELRKMVATGIEQLDRGEGIDGDEVFKRLHEKIRKDSGESP